MKVLLFAFAALGAGCGGKFDDILEELKEHHKPGPKPPKPEPCVFKAFLLGDNVVPPALTEASGVATFTPRLADNRIDFVVDVSDIEDVVGSHLHRAGAGASGPIVIDLLFSDPPPGPFEGRLTSGYIPGGPDVLQALIADMRAGRLYVDVHTEQFPVGEIRGQIAANSESCNDL